MSTSILVTPAIIPTIKIILVDFPLHDAAAQIRLLRLRKIGDENSFTIKVHDRVYAFLSMVEWPVKGMAIQSDYRQPVHGLALSLLSLFAYDDRTLTKRQIDKLLEEIVFVISPHGQPREDQPKIQQNLHAYRDLVTAAAAPGPTLLAGQRHSTRLPKQSAWCCELYANHETCLTTLIGDERTVMPWLDAMSLECPSCSSINVETFAHGDHHQAVKVHADIQEGDKLVLPGWPCKGLVMRDIGRGEHQIIGHFRLCKDFGIISGHSCQLDLYLDEMDLLFLLGSRIAGGNLMPDRQCRLKQGLSFARVSEFDPVENERSVAGGRGAVEACYNTSDPLLKSDDGCDHLCQVQRNNEVMYYKKYSVNQTSKRVQ